MDGKEVGKAVSFDFGIDGHQYDAHEIGELVLWPMVDKAWHRRDLWRKRSFPGNNLRLAQRGWHRSAQYQVELKAVTYNDDYDGEEDEVTGLAVGHVMQLGIKWFVENDRKDMIIAQAQAEARQVSEATPEQLAIMGKGYEEDEDEDEDDEREAILPEHFDDPDCLLASSHTRYELSTSGKVEIETQQHIMDEEGEELWTSDSLTVAGGTELADSLYFTVPERYPSFHHDDIELIEAGLYVFGSPRSLIRALRQIQPVTA